ncbi:28951_t:CDS:2, partial [Racocetra persica]
MMQNESSSSANRLEKDIIQIKKALKKLSNHNTSKDDLDSLLVSQSPGRPTKIINERSLRNRDEFLPMSKQYKKRLMNKIDVIIAGFDDSEISDPEETWISQKRLFVKNVFSKIIKALESRFECTRNNDDGSNNGDDSFSGKDTDKNSQQNTKDNSDDSDVEDSNDDKDSRSSDNKETS